jgi:hypothetical protein
MRRLLITRRHVALDRADDYLIAWETVRLAVERAGGRAWLFRRAEHEDQFMEFLEWSDDDASPHTNRTVAETRSELDAFAAGLTEEWEDAL